jgi:hypothetical protein
MTEAKTWLLGLTAGSVILIGGCAQDATDTRVRDDAPASDTVPGPEPTDPYAAPEDDAGTMSDPNALPPSETVPPSDQSGSYEPGGATEPETTTPPQ